MKIKALKAHKVNSNQGDSHKDLSPCLLIGQTELKVKNEPMYLALFDDFELPIGIHGSRIVIHHTDEHLTLNKNQLEYLENIPKGMFKLYEI